MRCSARPVLHNVVEFYLAWGRVCSPSPDTSPPPSGLPRAYLSRWRWTVVAMPESIFGAEWWPLHVAVAWVLTRDREFTERAGRVGKFLPSMELVLSNDAHTGNPAETFSNGVDEAWIKLREKISDGSVPTAGMPFRRLALDSVASETSDSRRHIAPAEIRSLEYHQDGEDACLAPTEWRVAHESNWNLRCGYRDVHIDKERLVLNFPPGGPSTLTSEEVGPPMRPEGGGFMPLSQAVYWIATKGGLITIENIEDKNAWQGAYRDVLDHIASGEVEIIGRRNGYGTPTKIEGYRFSGISVDYPFSDTPDEILFGDEPHVRCYPFIDEEHWRREFNDKLMVDRSLPEFTHLEVKKSDVARLWPFAPPTPADLSTSGNTAVKTGPRHRRAVTEQALVELYGSSGSRPGITEKMRAMAVNKWLTDNGRSPVSPATIRRALQDLRNSD